MTRKRTLFLVLALLLLVAGAFAGDAGRIRIKVQTANVRRAADLSAPVLTQVSLGTVFDVVEKIGDWYKVTVTAGGVPTVGYLHLSVVEEVAEAAAPAPTAPPAAAPPAAAPPAARPAPAPRAPERAPESGYGPETRAKKLFLAVGYQLGFAKDSSTLDYGETVYQESASYSLAYDIAKGNSIDLALGYFLGPSWGLKVGGSLTSRTVNETTTFSIPHPLWWDTPRTGSGAGSGMSISETDLYLDLFYSFGAGALGLDIYGGPCYVLSTATIISSISFTESAYPYATVTVTPTSGDIKGNAFGFNAGASLSYSFGGGFGIYIDARYLAAKATYSTGGSIPDLSTTLGGFRAGGGLKIAF